MADALAIAAILSRFDVIAVQEARSNLRALRHVLKALGPDWGLILTDVNPPPGAPTSWPESPSGWPNGRSAPLRTTTRT
jgi:hypothetical protein